MVLFWRVPQEKRSFPVDTSSPYAARRMAEYLQKNGRLVLIAEGRLSRAGCLMKLFDGMGFLLHKTNSKVITCHLRGAHRLPFSPNKDRKRWFPVVTAHFSNVLTPPHRDKLFFSIKPRLTRRRFRSVAPRRDG